ncbi:integrase core domain-containing protein, partial [Tateyamaria sp.]|uniref:integrase core domain-containing protein n=1 Tax=Tateyamaria sp. TaxID=1929288 RepID=UPI0032A0290C
GNRTYIMTARRMISGLVLKYLNGLGFVIPRSYGTTLPASTRFPLTMPLQDKGMKHSRGAPYHPQTQGKIERWHQTLKNRILLENYFLPGDLEAQIEAFVDHYNHQRYHESINNVTPAGVYFGRDKAILKQRERIKRKTLEARRLQHRQRAT